MKKLRRKISLATSLSLVPAAIAGALTGCSNNKYTEYHILTINDFHGAVPGYGENVSIVDKANPGCFRLAKEINKILYKYPDTVLLSAGDENSGDSWSTCSHGQTTYPVLKTMGVRYCAVGNHAFEWGLSDMSTGLYDRLGRTDQTQGKYFVTSNIFSIPGYNKKNDWVLDEKSSKFQADFELWNKSRVPWADPYKILKFGNARVCLIGLATTGTIDDSNKDVTKDLSFVDYNASVHYTKHLMKEELGEETLNGIDSFILFTHCAGQFNDKTQKLEGEVVDLAQDITTDIDAIMSAHSHKIFSGTIKNKKTGKDILISQAGTAGRAFTDTKLTFDPFEKPGKRLHSISMEVKNVSVPTNAEEAKREWEEYCNANNETLDALSQTYNYERGWVSQFFSRQVSKVSLKENTEEMQKPNEFKGYYNGIKTAIDPFTKVKTIPGHDYWAPEGLLDHYGGWITRAFMLGYYYAYKDLIKTQYLDMPVCSFITQDSTPGNLASGNISVREMYDMIPYDNKGVVSYLNVFQIANILNYSVSGKPNADQTKGFKYKDFTHNYVPSLNTYFGNTKNVTQAQLEASKQQVGSTETEYESNYVCGPLMWYGIKANFVKITEDEKTLKYGDKPIYDSDVSTYRVATKEVTIAGKQVWVPDISIFAYKTDKITDNITKLDESNNWKSAEYWFDENGKPKLIPVLTNSFLYGGGNQQTKMFKDYQEYNVDAAHTAFTSTYTNRDLLERFLVTGVDTGFDWRDDRAPINIPWSYVKAMVDIEK